MVGKFVRDDKKEEEEEEHLEEVREKTKDREEGKGENRRRPSFIKPWHTGRMRKLNKQLRKETEGMSKC